MPSSGSTIQRTPGRLPPAGLPALLPQDRVSRPLPAQPRDQGLGAVHLGHHVGRARLGLGHLRAAQRPRRPSSRAASPAAEHARSSSASGSPPASPFALQPAPPSLVAPARPAPRPAAVRAPPGSARPAPARLRGRAIRGQLVVGRAWVAGLPRGRGPPATRSRTSSVIIDTNRRWVPGVAARASRRPSRSAACAASTSRSWTTSMWSETKPTGHQDGRRAGTSQVRKVVADVGAEPGLGRRPAAALVHQVPRVRAANPLRDEARRLGQLRLVQAAWRPAECCHRLGHAVRRENQRNILLTSAGSDSIAARRGRQTAR